MLQNLSTPEKFEVERISIPAPAFCSAWCCGPVVDCPGEVDFERCHRAWFSSHIRGRLEMTLSGSQAKPPDVA